MAKRILLISGPLCSGKTTLADELQIDGSTGVLRLTDIVQPVGRPLSTRVARQRRVARLDRETNGEWAARALVAPYMSPDPASWIIVDSVQSEQEVSAIRRAWPRAVIHIHLTAPEPQLRERFKKRDPEGDEAFEKLRRSASERRIDSLAQSADVVLDTNRCSAGDVLVRARARLGFSPRHEDRLVDVLVGGQYGSEGKGQIAAHLAADYSLLMRVGGPNAGHMVYLDPKPYAHHQLPSGTRFNSDAQLLIGPGAVLNVEMLLGEIADCGVTADRLRIDPEAMIINDDDIKAERSKGGLTETLGSTGSGTGIATARRVLRGHPVVGSKKAVQKAKHIDVLKPYLAPHGALSILEDAYRAGDRIFLEGTQGTGLSVIHGEYPHVTSRDTTVAGCISEAGIAPSRVRKVVMACRTYPIRVQDPDDSTSGRMTAEIHWAEVSQRSGIPQCELEKRERTTTTGRKRRVAEFDWELLSKAASLNGPTDIALTFADYVSIKNRDAHRLDQLTPETVQLINGIESVTGARVSLISTDFSHRAIIDRRIGW